jgi:hypothetical protein
METTGASFTMTDIETGDDVVVPLSLSVALAVMVWAPGAAFRHEKVYGLVRSSPSFVFPLKNSTLVMDPFASVAVATILIATPPGKTVLSAGLVMETTGGVFDVTEIVTGDDVVTLLSLSVALTVIV